MSKRAKKKTYRVENWSEYNRSLIRRGSLMVWIEEDLAEAWRETGPRKPGAPRLDSDLAIQMMLTLRCLFRLPLRATQGLAESLFQLMDLDLPVPDYSTLSRRGGGLPVCLGRDSTEVRHLVCDSTGLKLYGEGEWTARQHGRRQRRTWRKIHLAVDAETQQIEAVTLTEAGEHDAHQFGPLLEQIDSPVHSVIGDGAYDKRTVYEGCATRRAHPVIPPRKNAKIWQHGNSRAAPLPRDEHLRRIRQVGRRQWKLESGYHRRSLGETTMSRFKRIFGPNLAGREFSRQVTEARIKSRALNRMSELGLPQAVAVI